MTITFCGHREGYDREKIGRWLDALLPPLIEGGAETFYLGGYGAFDSLAAEAVQRQKQSSGRSNFIPISRRF